jgi:hypothetical protein
MSEAHKLFQAQRRQQEGLKRIEAKGKTLVHILVPAPSVELENTDASR